MIKCNKRKLATYNIRTEKGPEDSGQVFVYIDPVNDALELDRTLRPYFIWLAYDEYGSPINAQFDTQWAMESQLPLPMALEFYPGPEQTNFAWLGGIFIPSINFEDERLAPEVLGVKVINSLKEEFWLFIMDASGVMAKFHVSPEAYSDDAPKG